MLHTHTHTWANIKHAIWNDLHFCVCCSFDSNLFHSLFLVFFPFWCIVYWQIEFMQNGLWATGKRTKEACQTVAYIFTFTINCIAFPIWKLRTISEQTEERVCLYSRFKVSVMLVDLQKTVSVRWSLPSKDGWQFYRNAHGQKEVYVQPCDHAN